MARHPALLDDAALAPAPSSAAARASARQWTAWWHYGVIMAVVVLTRGLVWDSPTGEPDTARYVFGVRLWTEVGPQSPSIINRELSSGYYWLVAHLVRLGNVPFTGIPRLLGAVSLAAALATGPALYHLGTQVVSRPAALVATIALLLGPGWWWTGVQAHPQGLTLALQLVSLIAFLRAWHRTPPRPSAAWLAASGLTLTAALLVKSDAALLFPAYVGLRLFQRLRQREPLVSAATARSLLLTGGLLAAAYAAFTVSHRLITGPVTVAEEASAHIGRFLMLPRDLENLLSQLAPIVFGPGPVVMVVVAAAVVAFFFLAETAARLRWAILLAAWALPGYVFWLCIDGNNARHVIPLAIPIFWLGFAWLERAGAWRLTALACAAILGNLVVPANSGLSLYPSMNVPQSAALMRERQEALHQAAHRLVAADAPTVCYVGRTTQDYVAQYVLEHADGAGYAVDLVPSQHLTLDLRHADGRAKRIEVIGLRGRQDVGINPRRWPGCSLVETLEYDHAGRRQRYFGTELAAFNAVVRALQ
jgi:Dolichyl-phosphate-mannose-protein mannosyltransferase